MLRRLSVLVLLATVLAGCSAWQAAPASRPIERRLPGPSDSPAPAVPATTLAPLATVDQLAKVQVPLRDLRDLKLRLHPEIESIPVTVSATPNLYTIGDQASFWVHNTSANSNTQISATLVYSTPVAYVWVESDQPYDRDAIVKSIDRFSNITYPDEVNAFGSEWHPGVDGDPHLDILYSTVMGSGVAGYFYSADEYSRLASPFSNEKEMFYINLVPLNAAHNYTFHDTTLAHELQHMIHWNMDRGEDLWVNEGLSEFAQDIAEFPPDAIFVTGFSASPDLQLTTWLPEPGNNGPHYGSAYLFMRYLAQRFGEAFITALVAEPANGLAGVDATLRKMGIKQSANDVFADWAVANYAQQPDALEQPGVYGYRDINLPSFAATTFYDHYPVAPQQNQVYNYATDYIRLLPSESANSGLTFHFAGETKTHLADTTDPNDPTDPRMWWSNRADDANPRLTREFDLSQVHSGTPITLSAAMWWNIEDGYDYGYIMASRDGAHWEILPGQHTSTDNPSGNALGPGYTGRSGNAAGESAWVTEHFDLSDYAGAPVWVQFSYVTDDAVNLDGWLVDAIQMEVGGNAAPAVGGDVWQSEGWLYTDNRLPQDWLVQLMEFDNGKLTSVQRVPIDSQGKAQFAIEPLTGERTAVVAISGLAPVTTLPATYTYEITTR